MKRLKLVLLTLFMSMIFTACQEQIQEEITIAKQEVSNQIKEAVINEIKVFFTEQNLILDEETQAKLEEKIEEYVANFDLEEIDLAQIKDSLEKALDSSEDMSLEEVEASIENIFTNE